jgi:xylulokinase
LGSGADSAVTRAILADVLGAPVVPVSSKQGAALGAAMQAAVAFFRDCGEPLGFAEIASYLVTGDAAARRDPDARNHDIYQEMISRQQYLVDTLHPAGFL